MEDSRRFFLDLPNLRLPTTTTSTMLKLLVLLLLGLNLCSPSVGASYCSSSPRPAAAKVMSDSYVIIRTSDDSVLVKSSHQQLSFITTFSRDEFDELVQGVESATSSPSKKLFSFPHEDQSIVSVFEHKFDTIDEFPVSNNSLSAHEETYNHDAQGIE